MYKQKRNENPKLQEGLRNSFSNSRRWVRQFTLGARDFLGAVSGFGQVEALRRFVSRHRSIPLYERKETFSNHVKAIAFFFYSKENVFLIHSRKDYLYAASNNKKATAPGQS